MAACARGRVGSADVRPVQPELRRREPAALADGERPGRDLPGGRRRHLEGPARQRRDREHHRVPGVGLRRRVEADDRRGHPPRRPRARRPGDPGGDRGAPAVRPRVPDPARRRERPLGPGARGQDGRPRRRGVARRDHLRHHRAPRGRGAPHRARAGGDPDRRAGGVARPARRGRRRRPAADRARPPRRRPAAPARGVGPRAGRRAGAGPGQGRAADAGVRARRARRGAGRAARARPRDPSGAPHDARPDPGGRGADHPQHRARRARGRARPAPRSRRSRRRSTTRPRRR